MELFLLIVEGLVSFLDLLAVAGDVYSWIRGKDNRVERRNARREGIGIPPRDKWNRRVIAFSIVVIALTAALMIWKWK
ncbi:MAG TPA: hypothetical protein VMM76_10735 [Pirellulaceae bacterium]|nr:hypothetical protein [Pirellulaceae bacterium]